MKRPIAPALLAVLMVTGCATPVDLAQNVEVTDVASGWFDAGVVNGQNKIVPSATFRLKKKADVELKPIALNIVFKHVDGSESSFEDIYIQRVAFDGQQTEPITVRSKNGYTADPPQTRADMLKNSQFKDVAIQVFAKQSSAQWVELRRVVVERQILTR